MTFWPVLVDFTVTSHLLLSYHVAMVVNFETFLISPRFLLNFRKITKFQRFSSKALKFIEKKPLNTNFSQLGEIVWELRASEI